MAHTLITHDVADFAQWKRCAKKFREAGVIGEPEIRFLSKVG